MPGFDARLLIVYAFVVCENVPLGLSEPACTAGLSVPAWQLNPDHTRCHALSNSSSAGDYQWSLLDDTDPTIGVSLTYGGGDPCGSGPHAGTRRSLTLNLFCSPTVGFNELSGGRVAEEPAGCTYELSVDTLF